MNRHILTLAGVLACLVAAPASAQAPATRQAQLPENTVPPPRTYGQSARKGAVVDDGLFAAAAAEGAATEWSLSQLGKGRATDPTLKRFSELMIEYHPRLSQELKVWASMQGLTLPERPDYRTRFRVNSLAGLTGAEFDRCYAEAQLIVQMDFLALFEAEAERGADPEMSALASKALPGIKEHLKMIKAIAKRYMNENESQTAH
jgi:putative membrane protein